MGVFSHSYGGLVGGGDNGGGWLACRTKQGGFGRMLEDAGALF